MKFITYQQYVRYLKNNHVMQLQEKEVKYKILELEEGEIYNKEQIKEIDKKHDKMFRDILSRKKEMANFLNQFLDLREPIEENQIVQTHTDFVTKQYKDKQSDIVYRLKEKPIYFLIEHQSTINKAMVERIGEYVEEIMRKESIISKSHIEKDKLYPIVVPIVIYTGFQKWNAKTNLAEKQYQSFNYKEYEINLAYNLIAVQDYTFEELLEKKTLFSSIMIIEKCKTKEETNAQMDKIIEVIKNKRDKEILSEIIVNVITPIVGEESANKMLEKIRKKEEIGMSPFTKMILDWKREVEEEKEAEKAAGRAAGMEEGRAEGRKEGRKEGRIEGRAEGILETAKKMIQRNMEISDVHEITGISKKELENIKGMLAKT